MVLLEAMSYGMPIISSKAGGIEELIKHKINGLLLTKNNKKDLKKNIEILIRDKSLYSQISENARNLIKQKFTKEIMFNNIYNFIKTE